jgi:hypothetical protein
MTPELSNEEKFFVICKAYLELKATGKIPRQRQLTRIGRELGLDKRAIALHYQRAVTYLEELQRRAWKRSTP